MEKVVSAYYVQLKKERRSYGEARNVAVVAEIVLNHDDGWGHRLVFFDENATDDEPADWKYNILIPMSRYFAYVDVLRNEGPVRIHYDFGKPIHGLIETWAEKVGEGE